MTVQQRIGATPSELFGPELRRRFDVKLLGLSQLAIKIIVVNLTSLAVLLVATLHQADLRNHVANTVLDGLLVQADALASTLGASDARGGPESIIIAPGALDPEAPQVNPAPVTTIDRDRVERAFATVLEGTLTRARLFGLNGQPLADSRYALRTAGDVTGGPLPPLTGKNASLFGRLWQSVVGPSAMAETDDQATSISAAVLPEVTAALGGVKRVERRSTADGDVVLTVATPTLDASGDVVGALLIRSAPGAVVEKAVEQERAIVQGFAVAAAIAVVLSLVLAASINRPLSRLARAAERIKEGGASPPIPDLAEPGEIGELSRVLHDMTIALYSRMDAIEAFADEVAHELKNPLTSLRSAVETLPLARTETSREKLLAVIQHDVRRLDRLITDISNASRLDAELNRARHQRFDLVRLLRTVVGTQAELAAERAQTVQLQLRSPAHVFAVSGNDSRLGQVFTNLLDNARSFTPDAGRVIVTAQRFQNFIEVVVDDEGRGIDESVMERIFERFYTDRPDQHSFGNNSGLGLAISRQIVEAHHGEIFAENRHRTTLTPDRDVAGARFTVRLPVLR